MLEIYTLLLDISNNRVLCHAENSTIATAVNMGYPNTVIQTFVKYKYALDYKIYDDLEKNFICFNNWNLKEIYDVEDDWIKFRTKVINKKTAHKELLQLCDYFVPYAFDNKFLSMNMPYLIDQLNKCDVKNNNYTNSILTYSSFTNCDPFSAYKELELLVDGEGQRLNRIMSIYMKYRALINLSQEEELTNVIQQANVELLENSYV